MVLELQKQQHIAQPTSAQAEQVNAANTTNTNTNYIVSGGELSAPVDTLNTNSTGNVGKKTKRTVEELYNSIKSICDANGLNLAEAKNSGFLCGISGKTETELLNADQAEINQIIKKIQNAINMIKEDIFTIRDGKKELTFDLIRNYTKLADGIVPLGWDSVESFRDAQKRTRDNGKKDNAESLSERFKTMYGCDISKLSKEELATKLEHYFNVYLKTKDEKTELSDFSKLLFNSTAKEYNMFKDALEYLVANNRHKGYEAILDSFNTQEQRTQFSNKTSYEYVEKLNTKADKNGNIPDVQQASKMTAIVLRDKDLTHLEEYHNKSYNSASQFYNKENVAILEDLNNNTEIIKSIQEKLAKGEKLSPKEKRYLEIFTKDQHFRGDNAGQIIGVATNNIILEDAKENLLGTIHHDTYKIGETAGKNFYRDVLIEVSKYGNSLPEETKEAFNELMRTAIGENYTNISNNQKDELKVPDFKTETTAVTTPNVPEETKGSFGYTTKRTPANISIATSAATLYQTTTEEVQPIAIVQPSELETTAPLTIADYFNNYGGIDGFKNYQKDYGTLTAIKDTFNNFSNNTAALLRARTTYNTLNSSQQLSVIKELNCEGLTTALDNAKNYTLRKVQHVTLGTFGATKQARETAEKELT